MIIESTIGRIVWYWPSGQDLINMPGLKIHDAKQPFAAEVVFVWHDTMFNLAVKDHDGQPFTRQSVYLLHPDEPMKPSLPYCQWIPRQAAQAAQAAKNETLMAADKSSLNPPSGARPGMNPPSTAPEVGRSHRGGRAGGSVLRGIANT